MYLRSLSTLAACLFLVSASSVQALCAQPPSDVSLSLQSSVPQTVASASVGLRAIITNAAPVDYHDALVAIEVRDASGAIVDRLVQAGVDVGAHASATTTLSWHTSGALVAGTYQITAIFAPQGESYGDAFTDASLPRTAIALSVAAGTSALPPRVGPLAISQGAVTLPVTNLASAPYRGEVTWRVWDTDAPQAQPVAQTREIGLLPRGTDTASFALPAGVSHGYLEATLSSRGATQTVVGAWIDGNTLTQTDSSCTAGIRFSDTFVELGVLIIVLMFVLSIWAYLRRRRFASRPSL